MDVMTAQKAAHAIPPTKPMPIGTYKNLYESVTHQKLAQQPQYIDANQERQNEWEQAQYDSASTKEGQAYNSYMQHGRNQQNLYMEIART
jgi:hypothetical protein